MVAVFRNEAASSDGRGDDDGVVAVVELPDPVAAALVNRDETAPAPTEHRIMFFFFARYINSLVVSRNELLTLLNFVERLAPQLCLLLVGCHASAVSFPPGDVILAQLACPLNDIIFYLHQE